MEDSKDLISRQAAIDAIDVLCQEHRYRIPGKRETYSQYNEAWQDALGRAENAIGNLPSAQPEVLACGSGELYTQPEPEGNSIYDLEELAEKVGSATVYDAEKEERTEEHAEMHACDSIHDIEELAKKVGVATIEEARNEAKKDDPYKHDTDLISRRAAIDIINRIENMDPKAKGGITVNLALLPALNPEPELKGEILEAVEMLKEKYEEAKKTRHINKPLEYAISEMWQEFRRRNEVMR